jgi:hypothetical protein
VNAGSSSFYRRSIRETLIVSQLMTVRKKRNDFGGEEIFLFSFERKRPESTA